MENTPPGNKNSIHYRIQIEGILKEKWINWFNGQLVGAISPDPSTNLTVFHVNVPDQAALRGVVNKIWDLNLAVVSIVRQ